MIAQIGQMFASFWHAFQINHPVLGISFGSIFIGVFIICFAVKLLFPILGIGAGAIHGLANGVSKVGRSLRQYDRSYNAKHNSERNYNNAKRN